MNVLVAVASRHGSTREIAEEVADELRSAGFGTDLLEANAVHDLTGYDAVVLGSAVYAGSWLPAAKQLATRHSDQLRSMPVWLFSSGPLGHDDPKPAGDPTDVPAMLNATQAREHVIFAGKLDKDHLGLGERLIVKVVKAPAGDFRDWEAIRRWARSIKVTLKEAAVRPQVN